MVCGTERGDRFPRARQNEARNGRDDDERSVNVVGEKFERSALSCEVVEGRSRIASRSEGSGAPRAKTNGETLSQATQETRQGKQGSGAGGQDPPSETVTSAAR